MKKEDYLQITGMFFDRSIMEYDDKEEKIYFTISRHDIIEIFKELEKNIKED